MRSSLRLVTLGALFLLLTAAPAAAQYMRITTDNPADPTRLRPGSAATTILTITLDTIHDRDGSVQSCNSHTAATCGAPSLSTPLNIFSYTITLTAIGGLVQWGTFTAADANYTVLGTDIADNTGTEFNRSLPPGSVTPPGLVTLGSIPVTHVSGTPYIAIAHGTQPVNPFGFGTGFGTYCDAYINPNTYTLGDPADPCGTGDWFDTDGAAAGAQADSPPILDPIPNQTVVAGSTRTFTVHASDVDGDVVCISSSLPGFASIGPPACDTASVTRTITLSPPPGTSGSFTATVTATSNSLSVSRSFIITVSPTDHAPVLNPIGNMTVGGGGCAGSTADQAISASDPDGDAIAFTASLPSFATLTSNAQVGNTRTGNIHLAPPPGVATGSYPASVTATANGLSDTKSFSIVIVPVNQTPVLTQPANMTVAEGATADQTLSATDPCGSPLIFSKVSGPTFMTVTTINSGTGTASGNIHLAPGFTDAGAYTAVVRATDGSLTSDRSFTITVCNGCQGAPVLNPIANMTVPPGSTRDQIISGTDPGGLPLTFTKSAGPTWMTVTTTSPTTGNIHLAPPLGSSGTFQGTVTASNGALSDSKSFTITICFGCAQAPVLSPVANMSVVEGATADQTITATDPDGDALTFSRTSGPIFMTVSTTSPGAGSATGLIHLAPGLADAGSYPATVSVSDGVFSHSRSFTITVLSSGNRCPTANPGGPYSGVAGVPITFNGSASSDPDGNPLTYAWDFDASDGFGVDAVGAVVSHTYPVGGAFFVVSLTVTDNGDGDPAQVCSNRVGTTANITPACPATVFNGYDVIKLQAGKPTWFAFVQPQGGCYSNSDIVLSSFVLKYAGRQIPAVAGKTSVGGDKNGDGIQEVRVTFSKANLRTLFSGLPNGHNLVTVTIEANLVTGGLLQGTTQVDVVSNGSFVVATVAPNPLNPQATLTYTTSKAGFVRIEMFDIQGRLVRRIVEDPAMAAGTHEATIDGRNQRGEGLPSGVYFIRGTFSEGGFKQLITILK